MVTPFGNPPRIRRPRGRAASPYLFRLEDPATRPIHLGKGYQTIGRSRACDIVVPLASLHNRHAAVRVGEASVVVERLDAAAELLVNGVPVQRASLAPSDELTLGEMRLWLERRQPVAPPAVGSPVAPPPASEPGASSPEIADAGEPAAWLAALERLHDWSRGGALDRRGAMLGTLVDAFALRGAVLAQRRGNGGLAALNAWGTVAELLRDARVERTLKEAAVAGSAGLADEGLVVVALGRGSDVVAFAALGAPPLDRLVAPLRLALRFLAHELFRDAFREAGPLAAEPLPLGFPGDLVVGRAPAIQRTYEELRRIAGHRLPVLLIGEPGSGKLELARLLHASSAAAGGPFTVVDCGVRDETIERRLRELTVAGRGRAGTLVLRHVDALAEGVQPRLVAALDALRESDRTGSGHHPPRIVATLARESAASGAEGDAGLPRDLYYRLAGFELRVPPLRQRREDVPLLFDHFLCREMGARRPGLSAAALAALLAHRWEGNLRELQHEAVRVAARVDGPVIELSQLSPAVRDGGATTVLVAPAAVSLELAERFRVVERESIGQALAETAGHLTLTAELLGISRSRLRRRMRDLGIARAS